SSPTITNNTISGNDDDGIYCSSSSPQITNNIIVNNRYGIYKYSGNPNIDYNDVWNNSSGDYYNCSAGAHDISQNPQFISSIDFHLQFSSPCIDQGLNTAPGIPDKDKDGKPRILNGRVDMGAYEFQGTPPPPSTFTLTLIVIPQTITAGGTSTLYACVRDANSNPVSDGTIVYWQGADMATSTTLNGTATNTFKGTKTGIYTITATTTETPLATITITVLAGNPATMTLTANPSTINADNGTSTISAYVTDKNNNPVQDGTIVWFSYNPFIGTATTTNGTATIIVQGLTTVGTYIITATTIDIIATTTVVVIPGTVSQLSIIAPATTTITNSFTLNAIARDKYGNTVTTVSGAATLTNTTNSITPSTINLNSGFWTGSATITTSPNGGRDIITARYGTVIGIATITVFVHTRQGTVTFGTITSAVIEFGTGTLPPDVTVSISTSTSQSDLPGNLPSGISFAGVIYNIELKDEQDQLFGTQSLVGSATVSFAYSDNDNNGLVDKTNIREENLIIYLWNNGTWTALTTFVNGTQNVAWAYVPHFSTFTLGGTPTITFTPTNDDAFAYPSPWKKGDAKYGGRYIYFGRVSEGSTIRIYNIVGELIDEIFVTDCPQEWDIQSKNLASGIYIYCITGGAGGKKVGKFGVIK
ncbi:MAG: right-handed parallel beta-helix repeat-containing protein, partial [bacterium]